MDKINYKILKIIQKDASINNIDLARQLDMAASGIRERVKKLEATGVIEKYEVRINAKKVGLDITTFIHVETNERVGQNNVGQKLAKLSGVQEVHLVAGEYCYFIKSRVKDTDAHNQLMKRMGEVEGVINARTTMVLETLKECGDLDF